MTKHEEADLMVKAWTDELRAKASYNPLLARPAMRSDSTFAPTGHAKAGEQY
jgi:hypothetical protein